MCRIWFELATDLPDLKRPNEKEKTQMVRTERERENFQGRKSESFFSMPTASGVSLSSIKLNIN